MLFIDYLVDSKQRSIFNIQACSWSYFYSTLRQIFDFGIGIICFLCLIRNALGNLNIEYTASYLISSALNCTKRAIFSLYGFAKNSLLDSNYCKLWIKQLTFKVCANCFALGKLGFPLRIRLRIVRRRRSYSTEIF